MGINGAMFQMIAHGISSAGMFFMVGVLYDRVHHRNLNQFGGLFAQMPVYSGFAIVIFFAGLGLPGLCGFIGEVFVVLSVWKYSQLLAVISAAVVILTAAYILWAIQRVYLGAEYKGPHGEALTPMTPREFAIAVAAGGVRDHLRRLPAGAAQLHATVGRSSRSQQLADWTEAIRRRRAKRCRSRSAKTKSKSRSPSPAELRRDDAELALKHIALSRLRDPAQ